MHTTHIKKWGNSYAIRLPKKLVEKYKIDEDKAVTLRDEKGKISFDFKKEETLESLLARVTPENKHELIEWGAPRGKEIW